MLSEEAIIQHSHLLTNDRNSSVTRSRLMVSQFLWPDMEGFDKSWLQSGDSLVADHINFAL